MNSRLRQVGELAEARLLAPLFDRCAEEVMAEFRDDPLPDALGEAFLGRHFDAPEAVILVAEDGPNAEPRGLCVVGPFEDPLTGEVVPMVVLLYVHSEARHRGVARALVEEARRILARRGIHKLAARAGHNDDALISMGERWGFVRQWELMLFE